MKRWLIGIVLLLLVIGALAGVKVMQIGAMMGAGKSFVPPPESVTTTKAEGTKWRTTATVVGTLVAIHAVTLSAELTGTVKEIGFESGQTVRKGAILVRLDTSTDQAQLESAEADAALTKVTLERQRALRKSGASTPADFDTAEAKAKQAEAQVANLKATIAKKTIAAPFEGRIAIRQVELGQVLSPGTAIGMLQSVDPIYAEFWLGQQALADLKVGQEVRIRTDTFGDKSWDGKVSIINTEVDVSTRNVRVRATVPNAGGKLRPGMFANVDVLSDETKDSVIIPATAVIYAPYGDSVFVVEPPEKPATGSAPGPSGVARQRFVRLGERRGDLVAVTSGLKPGETIVSSGGFKLRNGSAVIERNDLAPSAELHPNAVDE